MKIELAKISELEKIEKIYADARAFMRRSGNLKQWANGEPKHETIVEDIKNEQLYTVCDGDEILAVFAYIEGVDETYLEIYDGAWKNNLPYGVIHRIAVAKNAHGKGVARFCFEFAFAKCKNLKIDTHRDNLPMQRALSKYGFEYCGIIYLKNGDERLAYQKSH